jgi:hypothetical protein
VTGEFSLKRRTPGAPHAASPACVRCPRSRPHCLSPHAALSHHARHCCPGCLRCSTCPCTNTLRMHCVDGMLFLLNYNLRRPVLLPRRRDINLTRVAATTRATRSTHDHNTIKKHIAHADEGDVSFTGSAEPRSPSPLGSHAASQVSRAPSRAPSHTISRTPSHAPSGLFVRPLTLRCSGWQHGTQT